MKQYPEYKDTDLEWLGKIPQEWNVKRLKYISNVQLSNVDKNIHKHENQVLLCNYTDVYYNEKIATSIHFAKGSCTDTEYAKFLLQQGDVIITKDSETPDDIGIPAYVEDEFSNVVCGYHLSQIKPHKEDIEGRYLFRYLQSNRMMYYFLIHANGVTRYGIGKPVIENVFVPQFSLNEQNNIADYLDKRTAQIDTLIEKKQKQIELLKEQRAAIINQAVTKGLNPDVKMKDSCIEWLGEIPEHWEVKKLKYVADYVQTGSTPPTSNEEYYLDGNIDWFTPADYNENIQLKESKRKISKSAINDGKAKIYDTSTVLLVGIGATLGKIGIIEQPSSSNQQINAITFRKSFNPYYGAYYLYSIKNSIISLSNAATLAIFNQTQTKNLLVLSPPKNEQDDIAKYINSIEITFDKSMSTIKNQITLLLEYRTALITDAVTGRIDVRNEAE